VGNAYTAAVPKYEGFITPRTFRFVNEKPTPYEFYFSSTQPSTDGNEDFFDEVAQLLDKCGLADVFGVRVLPDHEPELRMEVTEGTTNIMMPIGSAPDSALTEAL
jgi:hypothetical protein